MLSKGLSLLSSDKGLAPRARRDISAAVEAGRFHVEDLSLAVAMVGGALLGLGQLLRDEPERDDAQAADAVTQHLLTLLGMSAAEADRLCRQPLPYLGARDRSGPGS